MKITIERKGNGIHQYLKFICEDIEVEDLITIEKITHMVKSYNDSQIEKA